ncbi:hypothetical protein QTQ03_25385 [Micromonospora sp. WMMA1363]|uniref:hypothetical protein n=1 Tax=Micromonospora sp. WMMA1363 TaxID=3053985 RepID=UPI00259CCE93|nr:hypothetical protein [Micromonospora sp. WMMA1363]MDM4722769.1 hypothetical protein [Micromonospora sp. WMMA1363]
MLEIEPLPWQRWLLIHALELRRDGRFRYRTVLVLVARQNGKTTIVEVKNLWKLFVLQVRLVIGTAQNLDVSEESWDKAVEIIEGVPELHAELTQVNKVNGKKFFKLANGCRWKVAAASRKGGRGLSGDDVNLDELREHHVWDSWAAVTKTTMARPNPQVWAFSNAGDDRSVVLNDLQAKGRGAAVAEAPESSIGLFEWSAPDDVKCTCGRGHDEGDAHTDRCRLQDRQAWAQANPSLGYTITEEAIASALSTDPEPIFRTEVLCQRVPSLKPEWRVIAEELWQGQVDTTGERPSDIALAVQVNYQRTHTAIVAVGRRPSGGLLTSIVDYRPGTHWVVERTVQLKQRWNPIAIAVQDKGPTGSLLESMEKAGLKPPEDRDKPQRGDLAIPWADDIADAYGLWIDAVNEHRLWHLDEAPLNTALAPADTRPLSGGTAWDYRDEGAAPLLGSTNAHWAFVTLVDKVTEERDPSAFWV